MTDLTDAERADLLAEAMVGALEPNGHIWTCNAAHHPERACNDNDCQRMRLALMVCGYDIIDMLNKQAVRHAE